MQLENTKSLLNSYPSDMSFPLGDDIPPVPIPTEQELQFIKIFDLLELSCRDDVKLIANAINVRESYSLVSFAVRMSIYAARTNATEPLKIVLACLMIINDDEIDWRDMKRALSIIEHCTEKNGFVFARLSLAVVLDCNGSSQEHDGRAFFSLKYISNN
jgi:hypothetical protein